MKILIVLGLIFIGIVTWCLVTVSDDDDDDDDDDIEDIETDEND